MASSETTLAPDAEIARRVLPAGLLRAIHFLFLGETDDFMLVGGTALAGYYAAHRRSDDIDLFTATDLAHERARRRAQSMPAELGATLTGQRSAPGFFHALATLDNHTFTIDVALDKHLFQVGRGELAGGVLVADLRTLLMMKAATLVSRCGEKDLYDLMWLLSHFDEIGPAQLVELAQLVDGGANAESILMVLAATPSSPDACAFALPGGSSAAEVHADITGFRGALAEAFESLLENQPAPPLAATIRALRRAAGT